jgi:hypothetical protein
MNQHELNQAAQEIAHDICASPFAPEWEVARRAARQGIVRGLREAVDAEKTRLALAQIDAAFASVDTHAERQDRETGLGL